MRRGGGEGPPRRPHGGMDGPGSNRTEEKYTSRDKGIDRDAVGAAPACGHGAEEDARCGRPPRGRRIRAAPRARGMAVTLSREAADHQHDTMKKNNNDDDDDAGWLCDSRRNTGAATAASCSHDPAVKEARGTRPHAPTPLFLSSGRSAWLH
jgi:hypothetical protein